MTNINKETLNNNFSCELNNIFPLTDTISTTNNTIKFDNKKENNVLKEEEVVDDKNRKSLDILKKYRKKLFTSSMDEIIPNLFVGSLRDSISIDQLAKNKIKRIVSLMSYFPKQDHPHHTNIKTLKIQVEDKCCQDILTFVPMINSFIHKGRMNNEACLIHCFIGASRSVTVTALYILSVTTISYNSVLSLITSKRLSASPNIGFRMQLRKFSLDLRDNEYRRLMLENDDNDESKEKFEELFKNDKKGNFPAEIRCLRQKLTLCLEGNGINYNYHNYENFKNPTNMSCCGKMREDIENIIYKKIEDIEGKFKNEIEKMIENYEQKLKLINVKLENEQIKNERYIKLMTKKVHHFNNSEYIFIEDKVSWYAAEHACSKWDGHLVSFLSEEENNFVKMLHKTVIWTGLNDIQNEGNFIFTDNSETNFINWKPGSPDNKEHNENCVEQDSYGKLNDIFCFMARPYICKR
ncbi:AT07276p [Strongyloides ratti]|uniref:AT07276p n=1 Tax=Strongyloides ratti TaxID=34506 RepID=A0A090LLX2_STRRB|nr:AT07276p [Strongyloides ratti]CEF68565.1 AT07276p [Strongyloides ratti]